MGNACVWNCFWFGACLLESMYFMNGKSRTQKWLKALYWNRIMRKLHAKCWTFRHRFQQKENCGLGEFESFDFGLLCLTRFWCCLPLGHTLWSVWFLVFDFFFYCWPWPCPHDDTSLSFRNVEKILSIYFTVILLLFFVWPWLEKYMGKENLRKKKKQRWFEYYLKFPSPCLGGNDKSGKFESLILGEVAS